MQELKNIEEKIKELSMQLEILQKQKKEIVERQQIVVWQERKKNGWKPFIYYSSYYGSECGTSDEKIFYAFSPNVPNIDKWRDVKFAHGDRTMEQTNRDFEDFLDHINDDDCDIVDDNIAQAVWPELYEEYKKL